MDVITPRYKRRTARRVTWNGEPEHGLVNMVAGGPNRDAYDTLRRIQAEAKKRCGFPPPLTVILNEAVRHYEQAYKAQGRKQK